MDDDCPFLNFTAIHTFKSTLPFHMKNANKLYECKTTLKRHILCLDEMNRLEMIKYCLSLNLTSFSLDLVRDIIHHLSKKDIIPIFIKISLSSLPVNDIIDLYDTIKRTYNMTTDDFRQLTFLDADDVISVEGLSKCININNIPRELTLYMTSDMLTNDIESKYKIQCLSKLSNYRELSKNEIDMVVDIYKTDTTMNGYCIDLLLKLNKIDVLTESVYTKDWYTKENVHYYELTEDTIKQINQTNGKFVDAILTFKNNLYLYVTEQKDYKIANDFVKMLCLSDYVYTLNDKSCRLDSILLYIIGELDTLEEHDFYKDCLEFDENICIYGILVNMFTSLSAYTNKIYLQVNTSMEKTEEKINTLKRQYPEDHEIWLDVDKIKQLLT